MADIKNYGYIEKDFNGKKVYICDTHNMALPIWGICSNEIGRPMNLITFDSHTDTRPPFSLEVVKHSYDYIVRPDHPVIKKLINGKRLFRKNFDFDDIYNIAKNNLQNDEHIQAADFFEYINAYVIVCNVPFREAKALEEEDKNCNYNATYYIRQELLEMGSIDVPEPFILDFDLDYFIGKECFDEAFRRIVTPLIKKADIITIALEQEYFEKCCQQKNYGWEEALDDLLRIISETLC